MDSFDRLAKCSFRRPADSRCVRRSTRGELIARGLGKLEQAPAGTTKAGLHAARPVGQNQRFARLKVAAVEHDQGAAVCRPARHVGAIDATLQPGAVKGDIVGTEPFKTPAKRSLEKNRS